MVAISCSYHSSCNVFIYRLNSVVKITLNYRRNLPIIYHVRSVINSDNTFVASFTTLLYLFTFKIRNILTNSANFSVYESQYGQLRFDILIMQRPYIHLFLIFSSLIFSIKMVLKKYRYRFIHRITPYIRCTPGIPYDIR